MKFPHAAKGISKIFTAEIISIFAFVFLGVTAVLAVLTRAKSIDKGTVDVLAISVIIFGIIAGIMFLVSLILNVVGYLQTAKDEEGFRRAVVCAIFSFIFLFVYSLLSGQAGFGGWLATVSNIISQVLSLCVTIFTIGGLIDLSAKCHDTDMVERGATILRVLIFLYIISFIIAFITRCFIETSFSAAVVSFLTGFATILSVILYFLQLIYLAKAKKMLREN